MQKDISELKERLNSSEQAREDMMRQVYIIPTLTEQNEIMKSDISKIRRHHHDERCVIILYY